MKDPYSLIYIIITLVVLIGYVNHRFIKLQGTIAIMAGALILSIVLLFLQRTVYPSITFITHEAIEKIDFRDLLLKGMLSFLLFAGSLTINIDRFKWNKWEIATLASFSTIASTLLIGILTYYFLKLVHLHLPFLFCFLFGALISPTDPIAVLATFKEINAPIDLETIISGESLFNDGVAIVIFLTLFQLTFLGTPVTFSNVIYLFFKQALGGIVYGSILGLISNYLIKTSRGYIIPIFITLATVTGGYFLALQIHISGPLAMVVAGIFVGTQIRKRDLSETTEEYHHFMRIFWEVIDEILNAILFFLIGFELLAIKPTKTEMFVILGTIPVILMVRYITVAIPMKIFDFFRKYPPHTVMILTWGGLRGGLAVALALSMPRSEYRHFILAMTYGVVAFAVIVQGITIRPLVKKLYGMKKGTL